MPKQNKILSPEQLEEKITKNVKKEIRKYIYYCLAGIVLIFGGGLVKVYTDAINSMEKLLVERVSREFEQPRIKATVQEVAANEAKSLLLKQIEPQVVKFKKETEDSVTETKKLIDSAQAKLSDLTTVIELEDAARFGSRKAYSRLVKVAANADSLSTMAKRRVLTIQRELLILRSVPGAYMGLAFTTPDGKKLEADKLSTSELFLHLESPNIAKEYIPSLMAHITEKPKKEVLLNAKKILQSSDSLYASAATCGILTKVMGEEKAAFLAFDNWLKVCEEELSKEQ